MGFFKSVQRWNWIIIIIKCQIYRWILDKISFPRDDDTQSSVISVRYLPTTDLSILGNWIWMLTYTSNTLIWSVTTRSSPGKWEKNSLVSPPEYVVQEIEVCHNRLLVVVTHFQCFSSSPSMYSQPHKSQCNEIFYSHNLVLLWVNSLPSFLLSHARGRRNRIFRHHKFPTRVVKHRLLHRSQSLP